MTEHRSTPISGTVITAITLGVIGLLMVIVWFGIGKLLGGLLGVAAIIIGGLAALNARRLPTSPAAALIGVGLGLVAVIWLVVSVVVT